MESTAPLVIITSGAQPLLARAIATARPPIWLLSRDPDGTRNTAGRSDVEIIPLSQHGFAAAANVALERALLAGHDLVVLLNDDAWLAPGARDQLCTAARTAGVAAAGALLRDEDGRRIQAAGIHVRAGGGRVVAHRPASLVTREPTPVDALPATALALRVRPASIVGGFDAARYPFYFEDVDLSLRLRRAGYQLLLVPRATAFHRGAATAGRGRFAAYHATRGHVMLTRSNGVRGVAPAALATLLSAATLLRTGDEPRLERAGAVLQGIRDGWLGSGATSEYDGAGPNGPPDADVTPRHCPPDPADR